MPKVQLEINDYDALFLIQQVEAHAEANGIPSESFLEVPERNRILIAERYNKAMDKAVDKEVERIADEGYRPEDVDSLEVAGDVLANMISDLQQQIVRAVLAPDEKEEKA